MTQRFVVHAESPQPRLLRQAALLLGEGAVIAVPTDACYVLACGLAHKPAVDRLRALRGLDDRHLLTLICRDLSEVGLYAQVDNRRYRFLREWTPGPYTFVLPATRELPRRLFVAAAMAGCLRRAANGVCLRRAARGEPPAASCLWSAACGVLPAAYCLRRGVVGARLW